MANTKDKGKDGKSEKKPGTFFKAKKRLKRRELQELAMREINAPRQTTHMRRSGWISAYYFLNSLRRIPLESAVYFLIQKSRTIGVSVFQEYFLFTHF